jgi:hypothetical protein
MRSSCSKRCSVSKASGLFIHSYPKLKSSPTKHSATMQPHTDGRPTYNGVQPGSPMWLLTPLLILPQCHAAFGTIPSTLAWVDQSPVNQRVTVTLYRISPPHLLPPLIWPRVQTASMWQSNSPQAPHPHLLPSLHNPEVRMRGCIYGRRPILYNAVIHIWTS